jgi:NTE family protein
MEDHLPVRTFERLATPLVLVATDLTAQAPVVLDSGDLPTAIHATCAYPGLFQAVRRDHHLLWDGGIVDKAPVLALHHSRLGSSLDALLVHYLPSHDAATEPSGALAWPTGMAAGFAAVRRDHFRLQLEVLKALRVPVYVVESRLPKVSPKTMHQGGAAVLAGREAALHALKNPAAGWSGAD